MDERYKYLASQDMSPDHIQYLEKLRDAQFNPNVCYDIGANYGQWTKAVCQVWPSTKPVLFEAFEPLEFLWSQHSHHVGVLSDQDDKVVKFYTNDTFTTGNSYYKENNDVVFPPDKYEEKVAKTLDTVVKEKELPLPDLIKIDVQGSEIDILKGAKNTIAHVSCKVHDYRVATRSI
jgi:FkbM family methyltransferase